MTSRWLEDLAKTTDPIERARTAARYLEELRIITDQVAAARAAAIAEARTEMSSTVVGQELGISVTRVGQLVSTHAKNLSSRYALTTTETPIEPRDNPSALSIPQLAWEWAHQPPAIPSNATELAALSATNPAGFQRLLAQWSAPRKCAGGSDNWLHLWTTIKDNERLASSAFKTLNVLLQQVERVDRETLSKTAARRVEGAESRFKTMLKYLNPGRDLADHPQHIHTQETGDV